MFSIGFTDEPLEYPYDDTRVPAAPGLLIIGKTMEGLLANLAKWNKKTYESHWKGELQSLLNGNAKATLLTSFADRKDSSNIEIWPLYLDGEWARVQNQLLSYDNLPPDFSPSAISQFLPDRMTVTAQGNPISEWTVPLREIEAFLEGNGWEVGGSGWLGRQK